VVPKFISAIAEGRPVTIHGDGEQSRDFTYIANVVSANLLAAQAKGAGGAVINVATGGSETVNTLADTIGRLLGLPVEKQYGPERPGDVTQSWADISAAGAAIGYHPAVAFEDGLRQTIGHLVAIQPSG
jgi:UDP-glucose 4-epimerase